MCIFRHIVILSLHKTVTKTCPVFNAFCCVCISVLRRPPLLQFLVQLCASVGGLVATAHIVSNLLKLLVSAICCQVLVPLLELQFLVQLCASVGGLVATAHIVSNHLKLLVSAICCQVLVPLLELQFLVQLCASVGGLVATAHIVSNLLKLLVSAMPGTSTTVRTAVPGAAVRQCGRLGRHCPHSQQPSQASCQRHLLPGTSTTVELQFLVQLCASVGGLSATAHIVSNLLKLLVSAICCQVLVSLLEPQFLVQLCASVGGLVATAHIVSNLLKLLVSAICCQVLEPQFLVQLCASVGDLVTTAHIVSNRLIDIEAWRNVKV